MRIQYARVTGVNGEVMHAPPVTSKSRPPSAMRSPGYRARPTAHSGKSGQNGVRFIAQEEKAPTGTEEAVELALKRRAKEVHDAGALLADQDGEIDRIIEQIFCQVDSDSQGFLTVNVLLTLNLAKAGFKGRPFEAKHEARCRRDFADMNRNGDGKCTRDEFRNSIILGMVKPMRAMGVPHKDILKALVDSHSENEAAIAWFKDQ